jgi:hypothetical protein
MLKISYSFCCFNIKATINVPAVKRESWSRQKLIQNLLLLFVYVQVYFLFLFRTRDSKAFFLNKSLHLNYQSRQLTKRFFFDARNGCYRPLNVITAFNKIEKMYKLIPFRTIHNFTSSYLDYPMPRRVMCVQPEELRQVGRPCARWRDEVGQDAGIKEMVGNSHESRSVEETSERDQDSL